MFLGHLAEISKENVPIHGISANIFEEVLKFIYTGTDVTSEIESRQQLGMDLKQGFTYTSAKYRSQLLAGLSDTLREEMFPDVTLTVEGREFKAHRIVLCATSGYFRAMFLGHPAEISKENVPIHGISANIFEEVLKFMYSGSVAICADKCVDLFEAADMLEIPDVVTACSDFLKENLGVDNCIEQKQAEKLQQLKIWKEKMEELKKSEGKKCKTVLDMMEVDMFDTVADRLDEIDQGLVDSIMDKTILNEEKYLKLVKKEDGDEYAKTKFNELRTENFKLFIITKNPFPPESLTERTYLLRIFIPTT